MLSIVEKINQKFSLVVLMSFFLGLIVNLTVENSGNIIAWALIPVMISIFSKIEITEILKSTKQPKKIIWLSALFMLIIPLLVGLVYYFFPSDILLGYLLVVIVPAGVLSPTLTDLFKGNAALSLVLVVVTHIIAPITIPLILRFVLSSEVDVSAYALFITLVKFIVIPLIIGQLFRKYFREFRDKNDSYFTFLNVSMIVLITFLVSLGAREMLVSDMVGTLTIVLFSIITLMALFSVGYFLSMSNKYEDKIASGVSSTYMNIVISIVIAQQFFNEQVVFVTLITQVVYFLSLPVTKFLIGKFHSEMNVRAKLK